MILLRFFRRFAGAAPVAKAYRLRGTLGRAGGPAGSAACAATLVGTITRV